MNTNNTNNEPDINRTKYLIIKFQIEGTLRFLSHSQTLSLFQRAVIRANINLQYSKGFNPRPKISLPLPRPLGVESDDELLVVPVSDVPERDYREIDGLEDNPDRYYADICFNNLSAQLPEGFKLLKADIVRQKPHFNDCYASYIFTVSPDINEQNLEKRINNVLASESLVIERSINNKNTSKKIDVRGFLFSIINAQDSIIVRCKISSAGSIRIQEIMELLELDTEKLICPIKRTNMQWLV